jgi:LysM repeat protein
MTRPERIFCVSIASALVLGFRPPSSALAADAAPTIYTVKAGDSCTSIARSFFGDARRVDLLHDANPQLGPQPHKLKPGTELTLPPKVVDAPKGPDARLAFVRNKVEVFAPTEKPGQANDPLYRGNRVSTLDASSANVLFRDETELRLGEDTLIVILGDQNASASRVPGDTTLVTGNLRAQLGALAGRTPRAIATPAGSVNLGAGEAKIHIDDKKTTRLAVYKGTSSLTAQQKKIEVREGMGSKAEPGKPPTAPRPLPGAPTWRSVPDAILFTKAAGGDADLSAGYEAGEGVVAAHFHVQLARDAAFNDLAFDTRVEATIDKLEVQALKPGAYFARVSAIDNDDFEGPFARPLAFTVARLARRETAPHETEVLVEEAPLVCGLDNAPRTRNPIKIDRRTAHVIRCSLVANSSSTPPSVVSVAVPADDVVLARVTARWVDFDSVAHVGNIALTAYDEGDSPLVAPRLTATASDKRVVLGAVQRAYQPGVYFVHARDLTEGASFHLRVRNEDGVEADTADLAVPTVKVAPPDEPLEPSVAALVGGSALTASGYGGQVGYRAGVDVGLAFPVAFGALTTNLRFVVERYGASADVTLPSSGSSPPVAGRATHTDYVVSIPLGYRLGGPNTRARLSPYLTVAPELQFQVGGADTATGARISASTRAFAVAGALGVDIRLGPGALFFEGGYREGIALDSSPFYIPLDGGVLSFGYRFVPSR